MAPPPSLLDAMSHRAVCRWVAYNSAVHEFVLQFTTMSKSQFVVAGPAIVSQAPCRADLAGGTIDLWPLYLFHPGAMTVNFAVNILTTCRITPLKGRGIHLRSLDTKREEHFANFDRSERRKSSGFPLPDGSCNSLPPKKEFCWKRTRSRPPAQEFRVPLR